MFLVHRVDPGLRILIKVKVRLRRTESVDHLSSARREIVRNGIFTGCRFRSGVASAWIVEQESEVVFYDLGDGGPPLFS